MPMKLVRRPRAARRIIPQVLSDMKHTYELLGRASIAVLASEISGWAHRPEFTYEVTVSKKKWTLTLKWDGRTIAGKIYNWVSEGTGSRGDDPAGKTYIIKPKKAKALRFNVPLVTKTTSNQGVAPSTMWDPGEIATQSVTAPGIFPRHLGEDLYNLLKSNKSGSFRNVTEASIKRSFRKVGIYVG